MNQKEAVETYQCPGCIYGSDFSCFKPKEAGLACERHSSRLYSANSGKILLGLPNGFNQIGKETDNYYLPQIYQFYNAAWMYDMFNVPVWKYKDKYKNTIIRGLMPRLNMTFIHIILEDCIDKIDCLEITKADIAKMA